MLAHAFMIDEFFQPELFEMLRALAVRLEYEDVLAPDGFTYPGVAQDVPLWVNDQILMSMTWWFGRRVMPKMTFFRLRLEGQESPHWVHTDAILAQYAFFMHMNPDTGSTALVHHIETGMSYHPVGGDEADLWERDKNNYHAWEIDSKFEGMPNRAVVIRADRLHAALPMSGVGSNPADGRLVLTSFFDL